MAIIGKEPIKKNFAGESGVLGISAERYGAMTPEEEISGKQPGKIEVFVKTKEMEKPKRIEVKLPQGVEGENDMLANLFKDKLSVIVLDLLKKQFDEKNMTKWLSEDVKKAFGRVNIFSADVSRKDVFLDLMHKFMVDAKDLQRMGIDKKMVDLINEKVVRDFVLKNATDSLKEAGVTMPKDVLDYARNIPPKNNN